MSVEFANVDGAALLRELEELLLVIPAAHVPSQLKNVGMPNTEAPTSSFGSGLPSVAFGERLHAA